MIPSHLVSSTKLKAIIAASLITTLGLSSLGQRAQAQQTPNTKQGPVDREQLRPAFALSEAFRQVARSLAPSVVNIRNTQKLNVPAMNQEQDDQQNPNQDPQQMDPNDLLRRFFGDAPDGSRQFRFGTPGAPTPRERVGEGTGVIVREDGYILTNNHVVEGATELRVKLDDDREYDAKVIGTDPDTDLAVVKVDASGLVPANLGDSDSMQVGDWVLAMGSPFGLQHTVTAGIVSAKGRANIGLSTFEDFIQTDAAINPGNSGGPLVNLYGEVIGINSAISTSTGTYSGVGLSIPSNIVKPVLKAIIEHGKVERGALGVSIQPLTKKEAEFYGFKGTDGVLIAEVFPDTAAEKAGINVGDIVTKIDGKPTNDRRVLLNAVADHRPGDKINVEVFRDGKSRTFDVTLASRDQFQANAGGGVRNRPGSESPRQSTSTFGISVQGLTPQLTRQLNAQSRTGVVVSKVTPDSPAAQQGIEPGDLIMRVGEKEITSVDDFKSAMQDADLAKGVSLQVFRNGGTRIVVLKYEDESKPAKKN